MVSAEEFFGANAGKVWVALRNSGPMTAAKICEVAEIEEHDVRGALGWLGREGKLHIEKNHKNYVYSVTD